MDMHVYLDNRRRHHFRSIQGRSYGDCDGTNVLISQCGHCVHVNFTKLAVGYLLAQRNVIIKYLKRPLSRCSSFSFSTAPATTVNETKRVGINRTLNREYKIHFYMVVDICVRLLLAH